MKIIWKGKGARECGYFKGKIIKIDPRYFRPTEVDSLKGDATKQEKNLNGNQKLVLKN